MKWCTDLLINTTRKCYCR